MLSVDTVSRIIYTKSTPSHSGTIHLATDKGIQNLLQSVKEANDKLFKAAKSGTIDDVENLLNEEGKAQVNATNQDGKTPLHLAAESGRKEIVVALINAKANVDAQDKHGAPRSAWRTVGENPTQTKSSQQFGTDHYVA